MMRTGVLLAACMAFVACSGGPPDVTPTAEPAASESLPPIASSPTAEPPTATSPPVATERPVAEGLFVRNRSEADVVVRLRGGIRRDVLVPAGQTGRLVDAASLEGASDGPRVDVYDARCRRRLDRLGMVTESLALVDIDRRRNARLLTGQDAQEVARPGAAALQTTDRC